MKIRPVGPELFHAYGRTDGRTDRQTDRTDRTTLTVAAPKTHTYSGPPVNPEGPDNFGLYIKEYCPLILIFQFIIIIIMWAG